MRRGEGGCDHGHDGDGDDDDGDDKSQSNDRLRRLLDVCNGVVGDLGLPQLYASGAQGQVISAETGSRGTQQGGQDGHYDDWFHVSLAWSLEGLADKTPAFVAGVLSDIWGDEHVSLSRISIAVDAVHVKVGNAIHVLRLKGNR